MRSPARRARSTTSGSQGANEYELVFETGCRPRICRRCCCIRCPLSRPRWTSTGRSTTASQTPRSPPVRTFSASGPRRSADRLLEEREVHRHAERAGRKGRRSKLATPDTYFTMYQNNEIDYLEEPGAGRVDAHDGRRGDGQGGPLRGRRLPDLVHLLRRDQGAVRRQRSARRGVTPSTATRSRRRCSARTARRPTPGWRRVSRPRSARRCRTSRSSIPAMAKDLLSQAGFPDGKDFPKQTDVAACAEPARQDGGRRPLRDAQGEPEHRGRARGA